MATFRFPARRLVLAGGFAVAVAAAPAIASFAVPTGATPSPPTAACTSGEEEDVYTTVCTPMLVPNSGAPFSAILGNPDVPAVNLPGGGGAIPCTGHNSGECIGLAEEAEAAGPPPKMESTISSSP